METLPTRRASLRLFAVAALGLLAACGRKADPKPPADADPRSPRSYPVDCNPPAEPTPPEDPSLAPPVPTPLPGPYIPR